LAAALGRKTAEAFAVGLDVLHDAFIDDSTYRLAAWLRQETAASPESGDLGRTSRTLPMKQEEIANRVGLRRDTLNQKLKSLETSGIISVLPSREIVVHDIERLDQLADLSIRTDFSTFSTVRDTISDALLSGNAFQARNLALEALANFPNHPEIRHQSILALLRCGSAIEAAGLLRSFGWDSGLDAVLSSIGDGYAAPRGRGRRNDSEDETDEDAEEEKRWTRDRQANERRLRIDIPALSARVAKELAFLTPSSGLREFRLAAAEASARYAALADRFNDSYCAVNAAAMASLAGDEPKARTYAQRSIVRKEPQTYWDYATLLEAHMILGQREKAIAAAIAGTNLPLTDVSRTGMIASTRLQLRRLTPVCGNLAVELRDMLRQKRVVYATGHLPPQPDLELAEWKSAEPDLRVAIDEVYNDLSIGALVCALAAGSDLLLAERAIAAEAAVHVILPVSIHEFIERSVQIGDANAKRYWQHRFDAVLAQARTVTVLEEDKPLKARLPFDQAVYYANRHAAGLSLLQADEWESEAVMVCVHDGSRPGSIAGTSRIVADWQRQGHRAFSIACKWRKDCPLISEEKQPDSFAGVLFVWLALPEDRDRHRTKSDSTIDTHLSRVEANISKLLLPEEKLHRRVLAGQMIGLFIATRDLVRVQHVAAVMSKTSISGLDGTRLIADFGSVFTGNRLSETRLATLLGSRDNIELPLDTVILTHAFAAEARLGTREPAPFAQIGLQSRKSDNNIIPRSAVRYFRGLM
jgi:hypothetical protein